MCKVAGVLCPWAFAGENQPVLLLRGGLVADGIGSVTRRGDVLTDGPQIASVDARGAAPAGCDVIELAPGSVVCPGFIDAHAHAEGPLLATGRVDGALAQGVTTLVVGQDGESWIGASPATARYLNQYFAPVNGALDPPRDLSVAAYRDAVSGRLTPERRRAGLAGHDPAQRRGPAARPAGAR